MTGFTAHIKQSALSLACLLLVGTACAEAVSPQTVQATMKRATQFMVNKVSHQGGYVWSYLPDMSRRWGEMEATRSMIWIQPPGTPTMGHVFLDAYHATGDTYYYRSAEKVASALIKAQHPRGGWNYLADFAGEKSTRNWYNTVGKNGWRLEEFFHYYGNATFDDAGTSESAQFLLRLYLEKHDRKYKPALDKAIQFILDAQYPIGGWPQRFPAGQKFSFKGKPDYTSFITLNDDVAAENIKFLIMVYQTLGDKRVYDPIIRAMNSFLLLQQGQPQPGFALQYTPELKPVGARSYEPDALTTHTTAQALTNLMDFYELTGESKFLARIPEALAWLEAVKLTPELQQKTGRTHPTFIELGTNKPLFVHRRGSNVVNGEYYADYDPENTLTHYSSFRKINLPALRQRYEALQATPPTEASKNSPLLAKGIQLPKYFSLGEVAVSDLNSGHIGTSSKAVSPEKIAKIRADLNEQGYWPTPLRATSHPYKGNGSKVPAAGDYSRTRVGDDTDTSPYVTDQPVSGIAISTYIKNMGEMIKYLESAK